jgi:hypothetical protein
MNNAMLQRGMNVIRSSSNRVPNVDDTKDDPPYIRQELNMSASLITTPFPLTLYFATWNVCGRKPNEALSDGAGMTDLLNQHSSPSDIYAICIQEGTKEGINMLGYMGTSFLIPWRRKIDEVLNPGLSLPKNTADSRYATEVEAQRATLNYQLCGSASFAALGLLVFVRSNLIPALGPVRTDKTGIGKLTLGDKGAVAISFSLHDSTFCFIGVHLMYNCSTTRRNKHYRDICKALSFGDSSTNSGARKPLDHDFAWVLGELNYPVELSAKTVQVCCL